MDTSGFIRCLLADEAAKSNEMLLTEDQANSLKRNSTGKRKAWMRNQPCICGSGKKFKKCCWARATQEQIKQIKDKK